MCYHSDCGYPAFTDRPSCLENLKPNPRPREKSAGLVRPSGVAIQIQPYLLVGSCGYLSAKCASCLFWFSNFSTLKYKTCDFRIVESMEVLTQTGYCMALHGFALLTSHQQAASWLQHSNPSADSTCEKARSRQRQDLAPTLGRVARARTVLTAEQAIDP